VASRKSLYTIGANAFDPLQLVREEAKKGAMEAVPEIRKQVREEVLAQVPLIERKVDAAAKKAVTPIVTKGAGIAVGLSLLLSLTFGFKRR
jgi:hypothetical protein